MCVIPSRVPSRARYARAHRSFFRGARCARPRSQVIIKAARSLTKSGMRARLTAPEGSEMIGIGMAAVVLRLGAEMALAVTKSRTRARLTAPEGSEMTGIGMAAVVLRLGAGVFT